MDVQRHHDNVLKKLAFLPGGRDRDGYPLLVLCPNNEPNVSYEDVVSLLGLLSEMASPSAFTVLVDARHSQKQKQLKLFLRACQQALYKKVRLVLIVQPDKFLEQQKINFDLILEGYEFRAILLSVHKVCKFVDVSQLPEQFGGTCVYDAEQWLQTRQQIASASSELSEMKRNANSNVAAGTEVCKQRIEPIEKLIDDLSAVGRVDNEFAAGKLRSAIATLKRKEEMEGKEEMIEEHAAGVHRFLDWIEGCGEKWLQSLCEVADNADEAEHVVKQHEQLEERGKDIVEQSTQLADMATRLMVICPHYSISLHKMREQVRHVGDHFAKRINAQSKFAGANKNLQSRLSVLTKHSDAMLESLCQPECVRNLEEAMSQRQVFEQKTVEIQKLYDEAVQTGHEAVRVVEKSDGLLPAKSLLGHVRSHLAYICQRHQRCLELVNVRRLKLQQFAQLYTSRKDCDQVVEWLQELYETLTKEYCMTDVSEEGIQNMRQDRAQLEHTAKSTYEYGKQLVRMSEMISRCLRVDEKDNRGETLEAKWEKLKVELQHNESRLSVVDSFNSTANQMVCRVTELEKKLREILNYRQKTSGVLRVERRRLRDDIAELSRIASLLSAQINADHNADVGSRQNSMKQVLDRVEFVENLYRRMESLVEEEPDPDTAPAPNHNHTPTVLVAPSTHCQDHSPAQSTQSEPVRTQGFPSPRPLSKVAEEEDVVIDDDSSAPAIRMLPPLAEDSPSPSPTTVIRLSHNESYL